MSATVLCNASNRKVAAVVNTGLVDPLELDTPDDEMVVASRRALCRVATVAAEAGARFQREGTGIDPMAWMLAPRRMFDGAAPLDACLERGPFLRGVLVHGLALDLDLDARDVDDLLDDDIDEEDRAGADVEARRDLRDAASDLRLFSATLVVRSGAHVVHAFYASVSRDQEEMTAKLVRRFGPAGADATIMPGFDPGDPMIEALVSSAILHTLALVEAEPASPLAAGLDLSIEQRFID